MMTDFSYLTGKRTPKGLQPEILSTKPLNNGLQAEILSAKVLNNLRAYQLSQRD